MRIKVIGIGAAGNKSSVDLIEKNILEEGRVLLLNSTIRDIPTDFKHLAITYSESLGGCGKERTISKNLCFKSLKPETSPVKNKLKEFIQPDDDIVVVASSTEGGTGSGSAVIIADYVQNVIGKPAIPFAFVGFEEDGRGLQNTIEYFQEMKKQFIVQAISNKKFLDEASGNKLVAEKLANAEFCKRISVLAEKGIIDSHQNIDHTDMFKAVTMPGFMTINTASLSKLKNMDQFNKIVTDMIDGDYSLDYQDKSQKRLAVFLNVKEDSRDYIDYEFSVIKSKLGFPYETFTHVQYNPEMPESISVISSGLKMPIDELKEIYNRYKEESEKVNKDEDDFFNFASELKGNQADNMFNTVGFSSTMAEDSFFNSYVEEEKKEAMDAKKDDTVQTYKKEFTNY